MIDKVKYPIKTLIVVNPSKGVFYGHPEICMVVDYAIPVNELQLNGSMADKGWMGLYPYNVDGFEDKKRATLGTHISASKYYVSLEDSPNKYIRPYLYQFDEDILEIATGLIYTLESLDFESTQGKMGQRKGIRTVNNPRGYLFSLKPKEPELAIKTVTRAELETKFTLT